MVMRTFYLVLLVLMASGCSDKIGDAYNSGFADGVKATEQRLQGEFERKLRDMERSCSNYGSSGSTEVCGGNGVNVNGKHYSGGKTGCVRVFEDGRVQRY